ncbi:hypothetical protein PVAP13_3KG503100 [Panicum virgatum]|uniref:Uncharacterized protein n=2 Tax=Panicum virgatum TaxID=38727 RepID=A0A8T0V6S3_PANVG|nr:hypothetical protein PVAP13_3KG503100 [Panicum virgatum]
MDLFGRHRPARRRRGDEGQERPRRAALPLAGLRLYCFSYGALLMFLQGHFNHICADMDNCLLLHLNQLQQRPTSAAVEVSKASQSKGGWSQGSMQVVSPGERWRQLPMQWSGSGQVATGRPCLLSLPGPWTSLLVLRSLFSSTQESCTCMSFY